MFKGYAVAMHDLRSAATVAVAFWDALADDDDAAMDDLLSQEWADVAGLGFARKYMELRELTVPTCRLLGWMQGVEELADNRIRMRFVPGITHTARYEAGQEYVTWPLELVWERDGWRIGRPTALAKIGDHLVPLDDAPPPPRPN